MTDRYHIYIRPSFDEVLAELDSIASADQALEERSQVEAVAPIAAPKHDDPVDLTLRRAAIKAARARCAQWVAAEAAEQAEKDRLSTLRWRELQQKRKEHRRSYEAGWRRKRAIAEGREFLTRASLSGLTDEEMQAHRAQKSCERQARYRARKKAQNRTDEVT